MCVTIADARRYKARNLLNGYAVIILNLFVNDYH